MWELPARCAIAAKRLESNSRLLGQALRSDAPGVVAPIGATASLAGEASAADTAAAEVRLRGKQ